MANVNSESALQHFSEGVGAKAQNVFDLLYTVGIIK